MSDNGSLSSLESEIVETEEQTERITVSDVTKNATWIVIFTFMGIALLFPWNIWIQQTEYFAFRLKGSLFAGSFEGWISVVFQVVNIATLLYLLKFPNRFTVEHRISWGLIFSIAIFLVASVLAAFDDLNPNLYFIIILFLIALSSLVSAILAAMIGLCSSYSSSSMTAMNSGQGIAGLMPSLAQIILKSDGSDKLPAIIYFLLGVFFAGLALIANNVLYWPAFQKETFYTQIQESEDLEIEELQFEEEADNSTVFYEIRYACLTVFMTLFVTLSLYPAITASVHSLENQEKFVLYHFLIYAFADFIGKSWTLFSRISMDKVVILVFLRLLFVPLILACNVNLYDRFGNARDTIFPLIFGDELFYLFIFLFGLSNGYLTTSAFIACPALITSPNIKNLGFAGDLMQLFLTLGLTFGSVFTFLLQALSCRCNPFI